MNYTSKLILMALCATANVFGQAVNHVSSTVVRTDNGHYDVIVNTIRIQEQLVWESFQKDRDLDDIRRIMMSHVDAMGPWSSCVQTWFDDDPSYVARHNGHVLGFINYENITDNHVNIALFAVAPEHCKQGYGQQLLQRFIDECKSKHICTISLQVSANNNQAIKLYEKYGFRHNVCESIGKMLCYELKL